MKRFLAILGAAMLGLALIGANAPAIAGPVATPKVTVRLAVSKDCTATVKASWSGLTADPVYQMGYAIWTVDGFTDYGSANVTTSRGRATVTFVGVKEDVDRTVNAEVWFGEYSNGIIATTTKMAPCDHWVRIDP